MKLNKEFNPIFQQNSKMPNIFKICSSNSTFTPKFNKTFQTIPNGTTLIVISQSPKSKNELLKQQLFLFSFEPFYVHFTTNG